MQRIETVMSQAGNALLIEGEQVTATGWSLTDEFVQLHGPDGAVFAQGPLGPVGRAVLPRESVIEVFAIGANGPAHVKKVRRIEA